MTGNTVRKIIFLFVGFHTISSEECKNKDYGNGGTVCVCDATYCDFVPPVEKVESPNCLIYTSNIAGLRFSKSEATFSQTENGFRTEIFVDQSRTYQTIIGFGGAITDAVGINLKTLTEEAQQNLMKSYFGPDGIEYTLIKVPIGASEFSTHLYTYDDSPNEDPELTNFKLAIEDLENKIPYLQQALQLSNNNLKLLATAWICPRWMKWVEEYVSMFGSIREEMLQSWANYHVKFLDAYKENNLEFWGITTGNEPSAGFTPANFPSVAFTDTYLSQWVANHFGPTIRESSYSNIKILTLDDQRILLPGFIDNMFRNPSTRQYIDGIAVHWYFDPGASPFVLDLTHDRYPDKFLMGTETNIVDSPWDPRVVLGSWQRGEDYATGIVENLRHWYVGWIDSNIVLNVQGGPSFANNYVDSPIIVNETSGEFYKQPMFYAMGHFSKFIPPESVRIEVSQFDGSVQTVAFKRPDGGILVNIINLRNYDVDVAIVDRKIGEVNLHLTSHSFTSLLYW